MGVNGEVIALGVASTLAVLGQVGVAFAQQTIQLDGEVETGAPDHVRVPFEVPEGTVEIEVAHDDLSEENILDWGLEDPSGFRGWGGGNTEPAIVGIDAASRSYIPGPIAAGTWNVIIGKAKIAEPPGQYSITVTLRDTTTLAPQPERSVYEPPAPLSTEPRWYAGDFHVHSEQSGDAAATFDEILDLAAERGLDFVVITDHNTVSHVDFFAEAQGRHPDVLLIPGIEVTTYAGHAGAIGATSFVEHKIGLDGATIEEAAESVQAQGALWSINHPAFDLGDLCIGCAWDHELAPELIDAMEIATSGSAHLFLDNSIAEWEELLAAGRHVAALGGSDDHRAGVDPGTFGTPIGSPTTMVYADELSVAGILAGIRSGRTVVKLNGPEDAMVELTADPPLEGDTVSAATVGVVAKVIGGEGGELRLVEDGEELVVVPIDSDPFSYTHEVTPPLEGELRVRAEVSSGSQTTTVSSHIWLVTGPAPTEMDEAGCGCRVVGTSRETHQEGALVLLGLALLRRRRSRGRAERPAC